VSPAQPSHGGLRWAFVTSSLARPTGGNIALFELVNAVTRTSNDTCTLVHMPFLDGSRVAGVDDLSWFRFEPRIEHRFAERMDPDAVPAVDVVVYTMTIPAVLAKSPDRALDDLVERLRHFTAHGERAVLLLQGLGVFPPTVEETALAQPGLKVCVGGWMVDVLTAQGVPRPDVVHVPNGVDPRTFRVIRPIIDRESSVAMNFDPHPVKGGEAGLEAIALVQRRLGVPATVFGTRPPDLPLANGANFVESPSRTWLAHNIYNASSIFLQPSRQEGFGMCAVESMASGCALVTTSNGGSNDYAVDGETALVCGHDVEAMASAVARLVRDDDLRLRLATNGARYVERFRWETSAVQLREAVTAAAAREQQRIRKPR
jgi:glycosyltransferase involved in cell wall biosynthesis